MRTFNYSKIKEEKWDSEILSLIAAIYKEAGKYGGGTYSHRDMALEFASWISPEIKLYIIKEFQRLKSLESDKLEWRGQRLTVKLNYLINTEAVSKHLITVNLTTEQKNFMKT